MNDHLERQRMWIFRIACAGIILHSLQNVVQCTIHSEIFNSGSVTAAMQNYVCNAGDILTSVSTVSMLQCSVICASDTSCMGFFYHSTEKFCVTCKEWYRDTNDLDWYNGMKYYRLQIDTAATCADWYSIGFNESGNAIVDPDLYGTQFGPVTVSCDFTSEPGKAITVLHHDQESRTHVTGYGTCGSYEVFLNYSVGFEEAKKIADISTHCKQYIKWECKHASLSFCQVWKNRHMVNSAYFTGPYSSGKYCECGDTGTCNAPSYDCECDTNDNTWRYDDGYITSKDHLPIYSFTAGDTGIFTAGDTGDVDEEGYHTIGPLLCW